MFNSRILFPAILIIVSLLVGVFYIRPLVGDMEKVRGKQKQIDAAFEKLDSISDMVEGIKSDIRDIDGNKLKKLALIVPGDVDEVRYLDMVNAIIVSHGLRPSGLSISGLDEEEVARGPVPADDGVPGGSGEASIRPFDVEFSVAATYGQFKALMADIERSIIIFDDAQITLSGAEVASGEEDGQSSSEGDMGEPVYNFSVKMQAYIKK